MTSEDYTVIRKRFRFTGEVQGVGFRYRARYAARGCCVTGWVRNEWDGSVVMEAQGAREQINKMLKMIHSGTYIRIETMDYREIPLKDNERGFEAY